MRILSIVGVWFLFSTAGLSTYFEISATLIIGFKDTILRIFYSHDMIAFFEVVMSKDSIQRDFRKFTIGKDFVSGGISATFWKVTNPVTLYRLRVHAGSDPLNIDFWGLKHQCHVMERGKTHESNLNNRNEFSRWLRIISRRRTRSIC